VGVKAGSVMDYFLQSQMALVLGKMKEADPTFTVHAFLEDMQHYLPLLLEAYYTGDVQGMKTLATDGFYRAVIAAVRGFQTSNFFPDTKFIELGSVDLLEARMVDRNGNENPMLCISFVVQEIRCVRNRAGEIIQGGEDVIEVVLYYAGIERDFSNLRWVCAELQPVQTSTFL